MFKQRIIQTYASWRSPAWRDNKSRDKEERVKKKDLLVKLMAFEELSI